eukprot:361056-Chlamydomonas_euryale.AAC.2
MYIIDAPGMTTSPMCVRTAPVLPKRPRVCGRRARDDEPQVARVAGAGARAHKHAQLSVCMACDDEAHAVECGDSAHGAANVTDADER